MPIKIPNLLPATQVLLDENIFVMTETRAMTQDIRPLKILMLNLMPQKIVTETQIARLIGNTPLQVELELYALLLCKCIYRITAQTKGRCTLNTAVRERYLTKLLANNLAVNYKTNGCVTQKYIVDILCLWVRCYKGSE